MNRLLQIVLLIVLSSTTLATAQVPRDYAVPIKVSTSFNPPSILISWEKKAEVVAPFVYRRSGTDGAWGPEIALDVTADQYFDANIVPGQLYEYKLALLRSDGITAYGFVTTGVSLPYNVTEGLLAIVVDDGTLGALGSELGEYRRELAREGWATEIVEVSESATPQAVKEKILTLHNTRPIRSILLFGRVPIPYSGDLSPDEHPDHKGAWPADSYYATDESGWGDATVNTTAASRSENHNVPGDGKLDQSTLPSSAIFEVGRVDLRNMQAFSKSETELLRQYLDKAVRFKRGELVPTRGAFVSDELGKLAANDIPATQAWRTFPLFVDAIGEGNWMDVLSSDTYAWAYGCGFASYTNLGLVGSTNDYASRDPKALFTMLFGSYFGDWDNINNLLRAPLATSTGLTSCYAGRPYWYLHPMAIGKTIGYATRLSQNTKAYLNSPNMQGVQMALMGDPTLKLRYSKESVDDLVVTQGDASAILKWGPSPEFDGYYVYRASRPEGPFVLLTPSLLQDYTYYDHGAALDDTIYMVRGRRTVTTNAGSFQELSRGSLTHPNAVATVVSPSEAPSVLVSGSMRSLKVLRGAIADVTIYDILGRVRLHAASVREELRLTGLAAGSYLASWLENGALQSRRFVIADR